MSKLSTLFSIAEGASPTTIVWQVFLKLLPYLVIIALAIGWRWTWQDYKVYKTQQVAAAKVQQAQDDARDMASTAFVIDQEKEYEERKAIDDANWADELDRVRKQSVHIQKAGPVRPSPAVCQDQTGNDRLSHALEEYRSSVRSSVAGLYFALRSSREQTAGLLATCNKQAADLEQAVEWVQYETPLWDEGKPLPP